jgi:hypothetical protein
LQEPGGIVAEERARLRINLAQREFEVEGSETFVRTYASRFETLLKRFDGEDETAPEPDPPPPLQGVTVAGPPSPRSFGELLHHLPRAASDVDRILVAGHYVQARSNDRSFSTGEANALLTEQGVKLGNPSQCVKQNVIAKRVFKHQGRYRVSQTGVDHLRQILGPAYTA